MGLISKETNDTRVSRIHYLQWGTNGQASIISPTVPAGKIWVIEEFGIATTDGNPIEWMMQVAVNNPAGNGGHWLMPVHR
jgi:hypothetical protein